MDQPAGSVAGPQLTTPYVLPPREIAKRLAIPPDVARQRLSRARAQLRERLRREHDLDGPRRSSAHALALPAALLRSAASLLLAMKLWISLAALAALVVFAWVQLAAGSVQPRDSLALEGLSDGLQGVERDPAGRAAPATLATSAREGAERTALAGPATAPRMTIVRSDGTPARGANAAWVSRRNVVEAVALDADAAFVPDGEHVGWRVVAALPNEPRATRELLEDDLEASASARLVLPSVGTLRGRVSEGGAPPSEPLPLWVTGAAYDDPVRFDPAVEARLAELVPSWTEGWTETRPDGSFEVAGVPCDRPGRLRFSNAYQLAASELFDLTGGGAVEFTSCAEPIELALERLPTIRGRITWEDGSPVSGRIGLAWTNEAEEGDLCFGTRALPDGRFEFGLGDARQTPASDPLEALWQRGRLQIGVDGPDGRDRSTTVKLDLSTGVFPVELGTIVVRRGTLHDYRVVDSADRPVAGAVLVSALDRARSDADGRAELRAEAGDRLFVQGPAHALLVVPVEDPPNEGDDVVQTLRLEPGIALRLISEDFAISNDYAHGQTDQETFHLEWHVTPFELPNPWTENAFWPPSAMTAAILRGSFGDAPDFPGSAAFPLDSSGESRLKGLRPGAVLHVELRDCLDNLLSAREVRLPESVDTATEVVERFSGPQALSAPAWIEVLDSEGRAIESAGVQIEPDDSSLASYAWLRTDRRGRATLPRLAPTKLVVIALADGYLSSTAVPFEPGLDPSPLRLVLARARGLRITARDDAGHALRLERVRYRTGAGLTSEFDVNAHASFELSRAPAEPLALEVWVGDRRYEGQVDADETQVELTLPPHGTLALDALALQRAEPRPVALALVVGEGDAQIERRIDFEGSPASLAFRLEHLTVDLVPGMHAVRVTRFDSAGDDAPVARTLLESKVTIAAGATTALALEP